MRNKNIYACATAISFAAALSLIAQAKDSEKPKPEKPATDTTKMTKAAPKIMLTKDGAVDAVMKMPEVKQFFTNVAKSKIAKPAIEMDRVEGDAYVVHVFEIVSDGPDSSHTATQNWYHVNRYTGKISKEF
jgi:PBP1b-binding outer membrane lipoprotein LpoB